MKKTLQILFLFLSTILYAQIPANNTVANATEITGFPYSDNNLRIDLSNTSTGGGGCSNAGYKVTFYKFTATESSTINLTITDSNLGDLGDNFLIFYTAPNLNITNQDDLSLASDCAFGYGENSIDITQDTSYYVLINRTQLNVETNILFEKLNHVPQIEKDALLALYNSTDGDNWTTNTNWNTSAPVSTWSKVTTINVDGTLHVYVLGLGDNNLTGKLPPEIGNLTFIKQLFLWSNNLEGTIPKEIGNLVNLTYLDLAPNNLSGEIPTEIGNLIELEVLWLNQNNFSGNIPNEIGNLTKLQKLYLNGNNKLSGIIPAEIGNLTSLETLNLSDLHITEIPKEIGYLTKLRTLALGYNELSGTIPTEIWNLINLTDLYLSDNKFSGTIPTEIGNLTQLTNLFLSDNKLSGTIPAEIWNLNNLEFLGLSNNEFSGLIPNLSQINNFTTLSLQENYFNFSDLKPLEDNTITYFNYSPQKTKDEAIEITATLGETITITLKDEEIGDNNNVYTWYKNSEAITNTTTNTLVLTNITEDDKGVYYCNITNPILPDLIIRRATVTVIVDATASLDEELLKKISLYPNPTNNKFIINLKGVEDASLLIYDVNGKEILSKQLQAQQDEIDISSFNNGVYILSITSKNKTAIKRLIKI